MPEYPTYPGSGPDQPENDDPAPPPPPPGAWPPPQQPQPQYQQPGYPPPGYPQPQYQQPGYPQPGYAYALPKHPNAMTAMVLGIVGLSGMMLCYVPVFLAPFAWFMGARAVREIDASSGQQGGRSEAMAGKVLGIIGTVLLVLSLIVLVVFIIAVINDPSILDDDSTY